MKFYNFNLYKYHAFVAQGIEHPPPKGRVARSNRAEGTTKYLIITKQVLMCAMQISFG